MNRVFYIEIDDSIPLDRIDSLIEEVIGQYTDDSAEIKLSIHHDSYGKLCSLTASTDTATLKSSKNVGIQLCREIVAACRQELDTQNKLI